MKRSLALALIIGSTTFAAAHYKLMSPASMTVQDTTYGSPQKQAPCGFSDTSATADNSTKTNAVTQVMTGGMLQVTINETIPHPGHYRVAIAQTIAQLPADPVVTKVGTDDCGMTTIMNPAVMPVLADGLFPHTSSFSGAQTAMVQLPAGFTCTNCVVQVIEYMKNHGLNNPGGCFYHHCATVTITDNPQPNVDGPPSSSDDLPINPTNDTSGGCCSTQRDPVTGLVGAALVGLLLTRKRRARSR
jgi:hypothetical protein